MAISHPVSNSHGSRQSKKNKNQTRYIHHNHTITSWKSESLQQAYSSNLLRAFHQIYLNPSPSISHRGQAIHEAADKVLASTAKGKTRWSRAILTNRLKLKFMKNRRRKTGAVLGFSRSKKRSVSILSLKSKNLEAVQRKGRVLGKLIPGCRKEPLPVVLEEASDYIVALEMQIKAMAALAKLLSGSNSGLDSSNGPVTQLGPSWLPKS
ncbi:hypothetical protein LguiA_031282 [Lonicera macranthoides]